MKSAVLTSSENIVVLKELRAKRETVKAAKEARAKAKKQHQQNSVEHRNFMFESIN